MSKKYQMRISEDAGVMRDDVDTGCAVLWRLVFALAVSLL